MGEVKHTKHSRARARVIQAFAECGRVDLACKAAKIGRVTHYRWLAADPAYREAFEAVREQVADMLEDEATRRAVEGVERPVTVAGEKTLIREYSDRLLELLLKARRPEKFGDKIQHSGGLTIAAFDDLLEQGARAAERLRDNSGA